VIEVLAGRAVPPPAVAASPKPTAAVGTAKPGAKVAEK